MSAAVVLNADNWLGNCLCGRSVGELLVRNSVDVLRCRCGVGRQFVTGTREEYERQYTGAYHTSVDRHEGCIPYAERYKHDRYIASLRWARYNEMVGARTVRRALDVGCANGAFVDFLVDLGVDAYGVDPDPAMARARIYNQTIADLADLQSFDLITMHDVLEHLVDPMSAVGRCAALLSANGLIVIDVPDVWEGDGEHHFKDEHLWYFTRGSLETMLIGAGLLVATFDRPIPGKLVAYGQVLC